MEMTYGGAMVLPRNYVVMDQEEMTYLEGGGLKEIAEGMLGSLIATALTAIGKKYITSAMVIRALTACAGAARAVWAGITAAAGWVWNTPVALAILVGVVGLGVCITISYFGL